MECANDGHTRQVGQEVNAPEDSRNVYEYCNVVHHVAIF